MTSVKICPKCTFSSDNSFSECPACGIIIEKYMRRQQQKNEDSEVKNHYSESFKKDNQSEEQLSAAISFKGLFLHVEHDTNLLSFGGRVVIFLVLLIWGWKLIFSSIGSNYAGKCLWHLVNLPFHEAGHVIFRFGRFMTSFGGTLGQLSMPLICLSVLVLKTRDCFAGSVCLWWFAENFMDIAPYINDARAGVLPLLGGNTGHSSPYGFHDWEFLLTETGLLKYDHFLAKLSYSTGIILMLVSFCWAGYLLWKQYSSLDA